MTFTFSGELIYWRGPAPFHFIRVPEAECELIRDAAGFVSYGWGMIPVTARIGGVSWRTSMWPKDGGYLLPVKAEVRRRMDLQVSDETVVEIQVAA